VARNKRHDGEGEMRKQKIRTSAIRPFGVDDSEISGWFDGKNTYLWIGYKGKCIAILDGQRLKRLAKAIVKHMDGDK